MNDQVTELFTVDPIFMRVLPYGQEISKYIWEAKYRHDQEASFLHSLMRVVKGVYKDDPNEREALKALGLMRLGVWIPAGRIQAGAGTKKAVTLMNCYADRTIHDSMSGIADALKDAMLTQQQGGGIGMDFSTLRPLGAYLQRTGAVASGPLPFMEMWDSMCSTIMSAGDRRGAMMGTMHCTHPDLLNFIEAKHTQGRLTNFNVSVLVTDAFANAITEDEDWHLGFGEPRADGNHLGVVETEEGPWYIYSVHNARELWQKIIRSTYEYSEPGVIFIDRINEQNNLKYCETISCTNPCVVGDTRILTAQGHYHIRDLIGIPTKVWNGQQWSEVTPFSTGVNECVEVVLSNNTKIKCTTYHKWRLKSGIDVEAQNLSEGNTLILMPLPTLSGGAYLSGDAYSQGFYAGDGTQDSDYSSIYEPKYAVIPRLVGKVDTYEHSGRGTRRRWHHGIMLSKTFVPINGTQEYCMNWLSGLLDADANLRWSGKKGQSSFQVELVSANTKFLDDICIMLTRFGITARGWKRTDSGTKMVNGVEGTFKDTSVVMINKTNLGYLKHLGLNTSRISLEDVTIQTAPKNTPLKVLEVNPSTPEETFCFTESLTGLGVFNGICTPQCGEQPLPPNGACNLGAVNLAVMVKAPFRTHAKFDYTLLRETIKTSVRFLDNVLDQSNYPLEAQKEEAQNKRRIGIGITGLANALNFLGIRYGSADSLRIVDTIMDTIKQTAYETSMLLAKERGPFPLFHGNDFGSECEVFESLDVQLQGNIRTYGIRNGVLLTVAPTGTTSLYVGNVSSGLEPVFEYEADRKIRQADDSYETYHVKDYSLVVWETLFPDKPRPPHMVSVNDLKVEHHLRIQAACQKHVDGSISKTINCPKDMTFEEFELVYWDAYGQGCKGCTTYKPSDVRGSILEATKGEGQPISQIKKRPRVLRGTSTKLNWPNTDASFYVTINDDPETGKPFEMFVQSTSSKYNDWTTALTLMISALMRKGDDISFVPEELKKVVSATDSAWIGGKFYGSLVSLIASVLEEHIDNSLNPISNEEEPQALPSESTKNLGQVCPKCNRPSVYSLEGCLTCIEPDCDYSKCN